MQQELTVHINLYTYKAFLTNVPNVMRLYCILGVYVII